MSDIVSLEVQPRTTTGGRAAAKIRKQGLIPGIIYGHKLDAVMVAVPFKELNHAIRVQHARTLRISLNGKSETVLIRELQWDYLGKDMMHIDFWRVDESERVKVVVPVELRGVPKTSAGAVLDQPMHQVNIECAATAIPEFIRVDISTMTLATPIYVSDLQLPPGVTALDAPESLVVHLKVPGAEPEPTETTGTEPEVLTTKKPKDEETEE